MSSLYDFYGSEDDYVNRFNASKRPNLSNNPFMPNPSTNVPQQSIPMNTLYPDQGIPDNSESDYNLGTPIPGGSEAPRWVQGSRDFFGNLLGGPMYSIGFKGLEGGIKAVTGEQSWGKTVTDFAKSIGSYALGKTGPVGQAAKLGDFVSKAITGKSLKDQISESLKDFWNSWASQDYNPVTGEGNPIGGEGYIGPFNVGEYHNSLNDSINTSYPSDFEGYNPGTTTEGGGTGEGTGTGGGDWGASWGYY